MPQQAGMLRRWPGFNFNLASVMPRAVEAGSHACDGAVPCRSSRERPPRAELSSCEPHLRFDLHVRSRTVVRVSTGTFCGFPRVRLCDLVRVRTHERTQVRARARARVSRAWHCSARTGPELRHWCGLASSRAKKWCAAGHAPSKLLSQVSCVVQIMRVWLLPALGWS